MSGKLRNLLRGIRIKMECHCSVRHSHPLCKERRFRLYRWWLEKHGKNIEATALTLGVSRRTAQRWLSAGDVPLSVAVLLDQLHSGPVVRFGIWRGAGAVRSDYKTVFRGAIRG